MTFAWICCSVPVRHTSIKQTHSLSLIMFWCSEVALIDEAPETTQKIKVFLFPWLAELAMICFSHRDELSSLHRTHILSVRLISNLCRRDIELTIFLPAAAWHTSLIICALQRYRLSAPFWVEVLNLIVTLCQYGKDYSMGIESTWNGHIYSSQLAGII